jgi:N6-L-threonylcarbamoyladenine synthase
MDYILGIDTSNYTTSLAAVRKTGELLADVRQLLPVPLGERGLRQSDALFFHVQHLPLLFSQLRAELPVSATLTTVGVSVRPRPFAASYMPVFRAGTAFAAALGHTHRVPVIRTTHQEGHIAAACQTLPSPPSDSTILGVHLSGGTSDVFVARATRFGYAIDLLGEGSDLHAGQFVDRVGVALGLPFPAGPRLEQLARIATDTEFRLPTAVKGAQMSFSGPCSAALRAIDRGIEPAAIAFAVQDCIAQAVVKALTFAASGNPDIGTAVIAGGVASNQAIRQCVMSRLSVLHPSLNVVFSHSRFASDNAVGVADIARRFIVER